MNSLSLVSSSSFSRSSFSDPPHFSIPNSLFMLKILQISALGVKLMRLWFIIGQKLSTIMRWFQLSSSSERDRNSGNKSRAMVYLNVYDLTPINNYLYLFGLGIFHSGIEGLSFSLIYFLCFNFILNLILCVFLSLVIEGLVMNWYDIENIN